MPERKNAILDVDGVCADFVGGLSRALGRAFTPEELSRWELMKHLPAEERSKAYTILKDPDFWMDLPVIEGAKHGVDHVERLGYHIIWATSPWSSCEDWESARRFWLNKHFCMEASGDTYRPGSDKENVDGEFIIDDKPDNVSVWLKAHPGKRAFLFDAPYNKHTDITGATRFTWAKVRSLI